MANYVESIERFVESVNETVVENLVKHLGGSLASADGATVAVTDDSELKTIKDGFCAKYLELTEEKAEAAIKEVAELMKHDTAKCRVTFYYMLADKTSNLAKFA